MADTSLTSASLWLLSCAEEHFRKVHYQVVKRDGSRFAKSLRWQPEMWYPHNKQFTLLEPSESGVIPKIFEMRYADVLQSKETISVVSVVPREEVLANKNQYDVKRAKRLGFGVLAVDEDGLCDWFSKPVPLVQVIPEAEFSNYVKEYTPKMKRAAKAAYDEYNDSPDTGVTRITELVEGMINKAAKDALKLGIISKKEEKDSLANKVDHLQKANGLEPAKAALMGAASFIKKFRNPSHHYPTSQKAVFQRYKDCRYGMIQGLQLLGDLREGLQKTKCSGTL